MLLDGEVSAPIDGYSNGKFLVAGKWVRGPLLVQYSDAQLDDGKAAAIAEKQAASQAAVAAELEAPYTVGGRVQAKACSAAGEAWFVAEVTAIRSRYPPVGIKFISTLTGDTNPLALPSPLTAFLPANRLRAAE